MSLYNADDESKDLRKNIVEEGENDPARQTKGATTRKSHHKFDQKMDPINFPSVLQGPMQRSLKKHL
jgi:hypothetical protein